MCSVINNELGIQNFSFRSNNKLTRVVDVSCHQTAQIIFIGNKHINQLKDGLHFDALFECQRNQLKDGWHFVFDDACVLIRHHSEGAACLFKLTNCAQQLAEV
jgi:hypothetical protein